MTRMIHIERTYRIELTETVTRRYVLEVQAASLEEAEEQHGYPLCDIEHMWDHRDGVKLESEEIDHAVENVEEL
jgi:hypothetical protein